VYGCQTGTNYPDLRINKDKAVLHWFPVMKEGAVCDFHERFEGQQVETSLAGKCSQMNDV
jgi:hypothetical protein